jgi:hypothetical protein
MSMGSFFSAAAMAAMFLPCHFGLCPQRAI